MPYSSWFIVAVVFLIIEIVTPGVFFFACLGIGAFAAALATFLGVSPTIAWIVFALASLVSIYTIRPIAKKFMANRVKKSNVDALIGQKASLIETVEPPQLGLLKIEGELWRVEAGEKIDAGTCVQVIGIKGTRLEVKKAVNG